jgi:hypothetical protein
MIKSGSHSALRINVTIGAVSVILLTSMEFGREGKCSELLTRGSQSEYKSL